MSLVQHCELLRPPSYERHLNLGFCFELWAFAFFRRVVVASGSMSLLLCTSLTFAQQGAGPGLPARNPGKSTAPSSKAAPPKAGSSVGPTSPQTQQMQQMEAKRMELEERRRLRQEIKRHGPDFRSKEAEGRPVSNIGGAPLNTPAAVTPSVVIPAVPVAISPPQPAPLQPLPSYFGWPASPSSNPSPSVSPSPTTVPSSGLSRPALTQEERQQLRQQIREERKRGMYPTPAEAER
jgi:hypothetical protein